MNLLREIKNFVSGVKEEWDPQGFFAGLGWREDAHNLTLADIGTYSATLAANRAEFAGYPNLQADPQALKEEWLTKYRAAYSANLLTIRRQAYNDRAALDAQQNFTKEEKAAIKRMMGI